MLNDFIHFKNCWKYKAYTSVGQNDHDEHSTMLHAEEWNKTQTTK